MPLILPSELREDLRSLAERSVPYEACGYLLGTREQKLGRVQRVIRVRNTSRAIGRFSIAEADHQRVVRIAAAQRLEMLALFHTHPGKSALLSPADQRGLTRSALPWLVISASDEIAVYGPGGS